MLKRSATLVIFGFASLTLLMFFQNCANSNQPNESIQGPSDTSTHINDVYMNHPQGSTGPRVRAQVSGDCDILDQAMDYCGTKMRAGVPNYRSLPVEVTDINGNTSQMICDEVAQKIIDLKCD